MVLTGLLFAAANSTPVQNYFAHKTVIWLSGKLHTRVSLKHVSINLFNHLALEGLYIEGLDHDTLLYAGEAKVRITDWFMFRDRPVLHYISLRNTFVHEYRTRNSNKWNTDFIAEAFASKDTTGKKKESGRLFDFGLEKIVLTNVRYYVDDSWGGQDLDLDIGKLDLDADKIDVNKKLIDIAYIDIKNVQVTDREYKGGKPPRDHSHDTIDTSPFNPDRWVVRIGKLNLENSGYRLTMDDKVPNPHLFDENHLVIKNINTYIKDISIVGDTIKGETMNLHAEERCGIVIKNMHSKISVSPVASICAELQLELNRSKISNYYAMRYKRFPNFLDYIDSVQMEGHLNNALVDTRDIEFFAPEMKNLPAILRVTGDGGGTVSDLHAKNILVTDGSSVVKGKLTMKGLPDIYKTYITYTGGEIFTNGEAVFKYAEFLRKSPDVDLAALSHVYFKGDYKGYIDRFTVNGIVNTNLGSVKADVNLNMPGFAAGKATYSGSIATQDLNLGILFRQPLFGTITCNEKVDGVSFHPDSATVNLNGSIRQMVVNKYDYQNISTNGTLSKKKFSGKLLVDDKNLALDFDGGLDYNDAKNIKINAEAHMLYSNLKALNITSDSITTAADFDLNCQGSNIDNFKGYARLYNVDLKRNNHKVDIDSVNLQSAIEENNSRQITIQSNVLTASIRGQYQLSKLPYSFQYYLSKYIPNYIKPPVNFPPDQNLTFTVKSKDIDSVLAITFPSAKGFANSTISGSLNTSAQKLTLNGSVPYGVIGKFHFKNVVVNSEGNLDHLALGTTIENISIGDSAINSSLSLTTTLANDSLSFVIATTTPDTGSSITLNGGIIARNDTLHLSIRQSEFFLNRTKWDIAGGSSVTYANNYLDVHDIALSSGLQKVTANSRNGVDGAGLVINTEELDFAQIGYWIGISGYQPDGRVNGTITLDKIFNGLALSANLRGTQIKLGTETLGTVNIVGSYDKARGLISFDPATGMYRDDASITASGNISFDSTSNLNLDGNINFTNARVGWASPFLLGIFSNVTGSVNGYIKFRGTSDNPIIAGRLALKNGGVRVDYTGCSYTIPDADITVTNRRISWLDAPVFDANGNAGTLSGYFSHHNLSNMRMNVKATSPRIEVLKTTSGDNNLFYGTVIASMDSFKVTGPFNFVSLHGYNVAPAGKSHIYIPMSSSGEVSSYNYITFKSYGKNQEQPKHVSPYKMDINIDANLNNLAEMTIVFDPSTGDALTARGEGNVQLSIPPGNDMRITGLYRINDGTYNFTFKKLEYHREFIITDGSTISFTGPFMQTYMDINATYSRRARLYDLLSESEINYFTNSDPNEIRDAKLSRMINVQLNMKGNMLHPEFVYNIDVQDKQSLVGNYAYTKLMRINQDDRQKTEQVGSFLLINQFIPSDGLGSRSVAGNVSKNNFGQLLLGQASQGITTLVNKLLKDDKLNVDVNYNNYSFTDPTLGAGGSFNRNQVKLGLSHPFLNDKLLIEVGGTSDWGRPVVTANNAANTNLNVTGDFRIQYILKEGTGLRLNAFRTSDYDVTLDKNITKGGVGISWRKSFDNLHELFTRNRSISARGKDRDDKSKSDDTGSVKQLGNQ